MPPVLPGVIHQAEEGSNKSTNSDSYMGHQISSCGNTLEFLFFFCLVYSQHFSFSILPIFYTVLLILILALRIMTKVSKVCRLIMYLITKTIE